MVGDRHDTNLEVEGPQILLLDLMWQYEKTTRSGTVSLQTGLGRETYGRGRERGSFHLTQFEFSLLEVLLSS